MAWWHDALYLVGLLPPKPPISKTTIKHVTEAAQVQEDVLSDHPLGFDINQRGYGSCQMLSTVDTISRKAGGVEYLMSLITPKHNGTYDVTLHDKKGNPFVENVDPEALNLFWKSVVRPSNEKLITLQTNTDTKKNLEANAPKIAKIMELAYMQTWENHPERVHNINGSGAWSAVVKSDTVVAMPLANASAEQLQHASLGTISFPKLTKPLTMKGFELTTRHAYAMLYDAKTDEVTLRNPWRSSISMTLPRTELEKLHPQVALVKSHDFERRIAAHAAYTTPPTPEATQKKADLLDISDVDLRTTKNLYRTLIEQQDKPDPRITLLQHQLTELGFLKKGAFKANYFDDATALAVQKFQQKHFVMPSSPIHTMIVDQKTLQKIAEEMATITPPTQQKQFPPNMLYDHPPAPTATPSPSPTPNTKSVDSRAR